MGTSGKRAAVERWRCYTCKVWSTDAIRLEVQIEMEGKVVAYAFVCERCWDQIDRDGFIMREFSGTHCWVFPRCDGVVEVDASCLDGMSREPRNGAGSARC